MNIIQQLQANRPTVVHLFDEIINQIPAGMHLKEISRSQNLITITGIADSNAEVSKFLRNIEKSKWLQQAYLEEIKEKSQVVAGTQQKKMANQFKLQIRLSTKAIITI